MNHGPRIQPGVLKILAEHDLHPMLAPKALAVRLGFTRWSVVTALNRHRPDRPKIRVTRPHGSSTITDDNPMGAYDPDKIAKAMAGREFSVMPRSVIESERTGPHPRKPDCMDRSVTGIGTP